MGETRQLELRLPPHYDEGTDRYPVLVVLDGGSYFEYMVSLLEMMAPNHFPDMIVVGVAAYPEDDTLDLVAQLTQTVARGDLDAARASLETALKLDPDNARAKRLQDEIGS